MRRHALTENRVIFGSLPPSRGRDRWAPRASGGLPAQKARHLPSLACADLSLRPGRARSWGGLIRELVISLLAAIVVGVLLLFAGYGFLLALAAYSLSGSLTLLLLATLRAVRSRR